ncbi:interferon a3-like [Sparus aurata]|uniref:Interferon a3-like n=1 Tax=Sparus aurata TaxID=8175 RepID=A0A671Y0K1_SPAAU|nr:interferon a3-like [Sparus aurata]
MLSRILLVCLSLSVNSAASSLSCRWITAGKFKQHSEKYLELLDTMANNSTNSTEDDEVKNTFPDDLYSQASNSSAEDKLAFTAQVLKEMSVLFEEDHSSASWEENTVENFVNVVTQQADELRSCIGSHGHKKKNKKLHMYFQRLSSHFLKKMGHSAEAWELIREEVKFHLERLYLLVTSATRTNQDPSH